MRALSALVGLLVFCLFQTMALAQGGPPMITDDPHTVGDGKWEINMASLSVSSSSLWVTQAPYLDVNYGVGDHLQLKYETGLTAVADSAIPYGGPDATAGARWKFYENVVAGFEMSTYPQYSFFPFYEGKISTANSNSTDFFLPLEVSQKFPEVTLVGELGYHFVNAGVDSWSLGVLLAHEMTKSLSILGEVHALVPVELDLTQYVINVGMTKDLAEELTLLASVGTSFATPGPFWISYLGVQIHL